MTAHSNCSAKQFCDAFMVQNVIVLESRIIFGILGSPFNLQCWFIETTITETFIAEFFLSPKIRFLPVVIDNMVS